MCYFSLFFKDPAHTEIYTYLHTLPLHDALPIPSLASIGAGSRAEPAAVIAARPAPGVRSDHGPRQRRRGQDPAQPCADGLPRLAEGGMAGDRKSTRLNSSH